MSGADDLRADDLIDDLIRAVMDHTHGREGVLDRKGAEKDLREYVADPERRMAIFDAMGLDVTDLWICPTCYETFEVQVATPHRDRLDRHVPRQVCSGVLVKHLVVRPREEKTDV